MTQITTKVEQLERVKKLVQHFEEVGSRHWRSTK
jgi:hypothetical protein